MFKNHNLPSLRVVFLALPSIVLLPVVLSSSISQMDRFYLYKLELEPLSMLLKQLKLQFSNCTGHYSEINHRDGKLQE